MDHAELAAATAAALADWVPRDGNRLESVEVVELALWDEPSKPAVEVRWSQSLADAGLRTFGLLMSVADLVVARGTVERWVADIKLSVEEPCGTPAAAGVRTWLLQLPVGV